MNLHVSQLALRFRAHAVCLSREVGDALSLEILKVGWGSEQPDPVEDVPVHFRGAGLDDLW